MVPSPDEPAARGGEAVLRLFLVELHESDDILPDQAADGAGAVHPDGNRAIGSHDISCAVQNLTSFLIETTGQCGNALRIHTVTDRKGKATLVNGLLGVLLRVHGGRNNLDAFFLEPVGSGKSRKLLLTVWSPVTPVQEYDTPAPCQVVRKCQLSSADLVDPDAGKAITRIEHLVGHTWHVMPPTCKKSRSTGYACGRLCTDAHEI